MVVLATHSTLSDKDLNNKLTNEILVGLWKDFKGTIKEELQTTNNNIKDTIKEEYQTSTITIKKTIKEDNQKNI